MPRTGARCARARLAVELLGDSAQRHASRAQRPRLADNGLLCVDGDDRHAIVGERVAIGRAAARVLALRLLVLHRGRRPLADGLALPLADRGHHVEHHPAGRAARVDLLADREQRALAIAEVAVDEVAQVADAAREPVELHDEQRIGLARAQHAERALERRTDE